MIFKIAKEASGRNNNNKLHKDKKIKINKRTRSNDGMKIANKLSKIEKKS